MDLDRFADPWEQLRLLSDADRNAALLALLERRAPGGRVLEVGCATGLWSCVAARLGAERVFAVEPTELADLASELVGANGLGGRVEVIRARIEDLPPQPVDLAFSELLNADPFYEGVVPAMRAAARWGPVAPRRLRVLAALVHDDESARERDQAVAEVAAVASRFDLRVQPVLALLEQAGTWRYIGHAARLAGPAAIAWDVGLGEDDPDEVVEVTLAADRDGTVGGVVLWFEAELDDDLVMHNRPGASTHWGQLVLSWPERRRVRAGEPVEVALELDDGEVDLLG